MIPKVIHYCWFGGRKKPRFVKNCIRSWGEFCPDFEIREWNENNYDVNLIPFTRDAYHAHKYAFVSDYARLWILYHHGGIYVDTDVELIKPLDSMLRNEAFMGFESVNWINSGQGIGAYSQFSLLFEMMQEYEKLTFPADGKLIGIGCPLINTGVLVRNGLMLNDTFQVVRGMAIYPSEYFNPYDSQTGVLNVSRNTISIHWYKKSWMNPMLKCRSKITMIVHRLLGVDFLRKH